MLSSPLKSSLDDLGGRLGRRLFRFFSHPPRYVGLFDSISLANVLLGITEGGVLGADSGSEFVCFVFILLVLTASSSPKWHARSSEGNQHRV